VRALVNATRLLRCKALVSAECNTLLCKARKTGVRMRGIIAIAVAIGSLWCVDALLNDGRYGEVLESGLLALMGK
jgi:hypothetical protein